MPLFEYRCTACDSQFELLIRAGSVPLCPSCGATTLERLLSLFAVSSDGTRQKSADSFRSEQRESNQRVSKERHEYEHDDHHH